MEKATFIAKKFAQLVLTLFAIATFNFLLFRILPGDPLKLIARAGKLSPEAIARLQDLFGLNQSRWDQYLIYLKNIVSGQYGISITYRRPVMDIIAERMSNTLLLLSVATIIVIIVGVGLGILAAMKRGTKTDNALIVVSMVGWSLPTFWTGLIFIIIFGSLSSCAPHRRHPDAGSGLYELRPALCRLCKPPGLADRLRWSSSTWRSFSW